jgi:hypothetical protein
MFFKMIETGRQYDTEQVLNALIKDGKSYDDQFLKHDIVFRDASRNIDAVIDFNDKEDRKDFLDFICTSEDALKAFIMQQYDEGNYKIANDVAIDQMRYYAARY